MGNGSRRNFALKGAAATVLAAVLLAGGASGERAWAFGTADAVTTNVSYNGKTFAVQQVTVDLTDPYLRVMPVAAADGIGHVESFGSMVERTGAVAAVNGTFFDAYEADESQRYPNGLMIASGEMMHTGGNQSLSVPVDKVPQIAYLKTDVSVTVKHGGSPAYTFSPWGVNKYYGSGALDQVVVYTRAFGERIAFTGGTCIVVDEGRIVQMTTDAVAVPENGFVVFVGNTDANRAYMIAHMHVGDDVQLQPKVSADGKTASSYDWEAAIGVGPKLLTNGKVDIDFARDGFDDPKITTAANVRSFVGVDGQHRLVMGTVSSATVGELANVLLQLGLTDAMNMDGGASSGLYANGTMLRWPGRLLSNALIVKRYDKPQVQIAVNGSFVHEFRGYIQGQTTMVPFRGIFERIAADFQWDGQQRKLTANKGGVNIVLRPDDPYAEVNGKRVKLAEPPTLVDDHMYIPLRFVTETLGAQVGWDQKLYRATLTVPK